MSHPSALPATTPSDEAPRCTICGKVAVRQDVDGAWWPPCEHAKANGPHTLQYPSEGSAPDTTLHPIDGIVAGPENEWWVRNRHGTWFGVYPSQDEARVAAKQGDEDHPDSAPHYVTKKAYAVSTQTPMGASGHVPPSAPDTLFKFGDHTPEEQSAAAEALHAANIARAVLRRRLDEGWSQGELAALAKTTQARVSEIESLKGDPKLSTLGRVAYALGRMIDMVPIDCEPVPPSAPDTKPDERAEIAALRAEREAMRHVIAWLLGEEDEFPIAPDELHALLEDARQYNLDRGVPVRRPRLYWWRSELRDRWAAAISVGPDNPANLRASSPPEGEDTQRMEDQ